MKINVIINYSELTTTLSRSTSVKVIQGTERIPENPDDPVLKEVLQNIKIKDANSVLHNQQGCSPVEAMVRGHTLENM